ncbi:GmrSD restriction endonuclease domain-containing protein [Janibacter alittae]|uniref:DUF1524 domain-containing protein n=1 Tax=Janibacter alittae TaxID=3115209 RepID=A0ABZ2MLZ4_9MICO
MICKLMWLMSKRHDLEITDDHLEAVVHLLTSFFVRRNLTGYPPTYALAKLFMTTIDAVGDARGDEVPAVVGERLNAVSATDEEFRARLAGRIYEENTDVARLVLATLAENAMTKETEVDLWRQEKNHFVWTIEHILPQGDLRLSRHECGWVRPLRSREGLCG